jgi:hypothetical protein
MVSVSILAETEVYEGGVMMEPCETKLPNLFRRDEGMQVKR